MFSNFLIEGEYDTKAKWGFGAVAVVVYGRDGKLVQVFHNDETSDASKEPFTYED